MTKRFIKLTGIRLILFAVVVISGWPIAQAAEQARASISKKPTPMPPCQEAKAGGPEEVVRRLYTETPFARNDFMNGNPKKTLSRYFEEKLTGLIINYLKCEAAGNHCPHMPDIFVVDNPITWKITNLQVCMMDSDTKSVRVQYRNFDKPELIVYRLGESEAGWRIADIFYVGEVRPFNPNQPDAWSMVSGLSRE